MNDILKLQFKSLYRKEKNRVKRLQEYIKKLEDDLNWMGTPMGYSSKEWCDERDKQRKRLEKLGDFPSENVVQKDTGKLKGSIDGKVASKKSKGKSASHNASKTSAPVGGN